MKVLVTGGAGFIGSHVVDQLLDEGHEVTVLDDLSTGQLINVNPACRFEIGDIRDCQFVNHCIAGQEVLFHLAGFTSVVGSIEDPDTCRSINLEGAKILFETAQKSGVKRVIFSSTSAIYADDIDLRLNEQAPVDIKSPYAQSKLDAESILRRLQDSYGLSWTALRYFNVYGPRQDADSDYSAVIPAFISQSRHNRTLTIYGDGNQTRDFVYVADVARANLLAMDSNHCGVLNVGTSHPVSILDLAETILKIEKSSSSYAFAKSRPGDAVSSTADITSIASKLKWEPRWKLEDGLTATSQWFQHQEGLSL